MSTYYNNHKNDPSFIEKSKEQSRLYYQRLKEDPERLNAYKNKRKEIAKKLNSGSKYYWANVEQNKEKGVEWYKNSGKRKRKVAKKDAPWRWLHNLRRLDAKRKGIEFTITEDYLESLWSGYCPMLGIPLIVQSRSDADYNRDFSPSVDRIDPSKGYVPGNVAIVSYRANRIKNDSTLQELKLIVSFLENQVK